MESYIYFEKQQHDNLCAQYALNSLLQGSYFTAVDLAEIAQQLDNEEQLVGGKKTGAESQNYDDSGFFSIQVLQKALEIWNLELIPWRSKEMDEVRFRPIEQVAYICNLSNHWFTLRRFSGGKSGFTRWYNLDSTQPKPTYIDERYLTHLLEQIEHDGYSVFVVKGVLPLSNADFKAQELSLLDEPKAKTPTSPFSGRGYSLAAQTDKVQIQEEDDNSEEMMLAKAIQASLEDNKNATKEDDIDEIRKKRLARFGA